VHIPLLIKLIELAASFTVATYPASIWDLVTPVSIVLPRLSVIVNGPALPPILVADIVTCII
jgi:hypothetical protein